MDGKLLLCESEHMFAFTQTSALSLAAIKEGINCQEDATDTDVQQTPHAQTLLSPRGGFLLLLVVLLIQFLME